MRRTYEHCAKCGRSKPMDQNYVCPDCAGTPGLYTHCAVGGELLDGEPSRCYVCEEHLA